MHKLTITVEPTFENERDLGTALDALLVGASFEMRPPRVGDDEGTVYFCLSVDHEAIVYNHGGFGPEMSSTLDTIDSITVF